jgi:hypothetical protein
MKRVEIGVAPVAALVGLALVGNHLAGGLGAGIALILPVAVLAGVAAAEGPSYRPRKKTFRHRYLLFLDRTRLKRTRRRREREARKESERRYARTRSRQG